MVSQSEDTTGFIPIDLTTDQVDLSTPPTDGLDKGIPITSGPGSIIGGVAAATVAVVVAELFPIIQGLVSDVSQTDPKAWFQKIVSHPVVNVGALLGELESLDVWHWMKSFVGVTFLQPLLQDGLGIPPPSGSDNPQAAKGLQTVESMVSFAIGLQFSILLIQHVGKFLLGGRWPETLSQTLGKIPEEMGLSWALGLVVDRTFEAAFGESLNNYIRSQIRPNKPEWQIARAMLRQHVISDEKLDEILKDAGFSDDWITDIKKLETAPIPMGDIQAMYQAGIIDDGALDPLLLPLGFSNENRELIKQLYITKAENAAGAEVRSVWRSLFRNSLVSEGDYRTKLEAVNFPQRLIDSDVQAVVDEKTFGWRVQGIGVVKSQRMHNTITDAVATAKLQELGFSHDDALQTVASWLAPPIRRQHGLTEAQILKYLIAGLLSPEVARTDLLAIGLDPDAVNFLLANPTTASGAHVVRLTPALVTQAYEAGAITQDTLIDAYKRAGATDEAAAYFYASALYKYAKMHHIPTGNKDLSEGHILAGYKIGIISESDALTALQHLGYSQSNAYILLEIENKGPITLPAQPAFASVQDAIGYLVSLGFTITTPIDPVYESALQMVEQAGYTVTFPDRFTPPTTGGTIGGQPPPPQP